jgi:hypothetical protein
MGIFAVEIASQSYLTCRFMILGWYACYYLKDVSEAAFGITRLVQSPACRVCVRGLCPLPFLPACPNEQRTR